jgi:hypothetical protein
MLKSKTKKWFDYIAFGILLVTATLAIIGTSVMQSAAAQTNVTSLVTIRL